MSKQTHDIRFGSIRRAGPGPVFNRAACVVFVSLFLCMGLSSPLYAQDPLECSFSLINEYGFEPIVPLPMPPTEPPVPPYGSYNRRVWAMSGWPATNPTHLYVGTSNFEDGGQIWRMNLTTRVWEKVLGIGAGKTCNDPECGLGNRGFRNIGVLPDGQTVCAGSYYDESYPVTGGPLWPGAPGAQFWCSDTSGKNFTMRVGPNGLIPGPYLPEGFGNPDMWSVRGLQTFNGYTYIGLQDFGGTGQLWRTVTATTDIERVTLPDEMGGSGSGNDSMHTMEVYDGELYIATRRLGSGGMQIWHWDGDTFNGGVANFCPLVGPAGVPNCPDAPIPSGFDDGESTALDIHVHGDYLFVGTGKQTGHSVWRIDLTNPDPGSPGSQTAKVVTGGNGDPGSFYAWRFASYGDTGDGTPYIVYGNVNYGVLYGTTTRLGLGSLYRSADNGDTWVTIVGGGRFQNRSYCGIGQGFGDRQTFGFRSMIVLNNKLYIGGAGCPNLCPGYKGAGVWVLDGTWSD